MITPKFSCSQTATSVVISVYVPAVRASDVEIHVDDALVSVHINPYFLRLDFPGRVVEDDTSSAVYDPGTGYLTVTLTKDTPGEDFKDLDILASLLAPRRSEPVKQPVIEVLGSEGSGEQNDGDELCKAAEKLSLREREFREAEENDWHLPQTLPDEKSEFKTSPERRYGFLNMYTGYFRHVGQTENEVNELGEDVESLLEHERRARRTAHEEQKWDEEYYMADFAEDDWIQELIAYKFEPAAPCSSSTKPIEFTEQENLTMLRLPQKEYLATPEQKHNLYLTLLTLLFAYTYDARTTQHDPTPESAWTICTLTPAISALDPPPYATPTSSPAGAPSASSSSSPPSSFTPAELQTTLRPSFRRALAFPLYRSFALCLACTADVARALRRGKRAVLRALLETKRILDGHDVYYVYSKVWVDDLCVWVARDASDATLLDLGQKLAALQFEKACVGWDLDQLEAAVRAQLARESDSDDESGEE